MYHVRLVPEFGTALDPGFGVIHWDHDVVPMYERSHLQSRDDIEDLVIDVRADFRDVAGIK